MPQTTYRIVSVSDLRDELDAAHDALARERGRAAGLKTKLDDAHDELAGVYRVQRGSVRRFIEMGHRAHRAERQLEEAQDRIERMQLQIDQLTS